MSENDNLSPCPFCGCEVERVEYSNAFHCTNGACDALVFFENKYYTRRRAETAFNRRVACFWDVLYKLIVAAIFALFFLTLFVTFRHNAEEQSISLPHTEKIQQAFVVTETAKQPVAKESNTAAESAANICADERDAVQHYTDADAVALAQMAWGECRGVPELITAEGKKISSECQQAATMWVALNRFDAGYENSIAEVVAAPHQFAGYSAAHPIDEGLLSLARDVLERWNDEKNGGTEIGRVIPAEYLWFVGDGKYNHFSNRYRSGVYFTWELPDVYAAAEEV